MASSQDLQYANLVRQALDSGFSAVRNGRTSVAESSWHYAYATAVLISDPGVGAPLIGECMQLRAEIDALSPDEIALRAALRDSEAQKFIDEEAAITAEQLRTDQAAKERQYIEDAEAYGQFGNVVSSGRDAADAAKKKAEQLAEEYKWPVRVATFVVVLGLGTAIVWKVA